MSTDANEPGIASEEWPVAGSSARAAGSHAKKADFILSSRRLWLLSISLYQKGHPRLARLLKNVNSMMYHNSLPVEASVSPDIALGHHGFGTVLHPKVVIGPRVKIFQNVTMASQRYSHRAGGARGRRRGRDSRRAGQNDRDQCAGGIART